MSLIEYGVNTSGPLGTVVQYDKALLATSGSVGKNRVTRGIRFLCIFGEAPA